LVVLTGELDPRAMARRCEALPAPTPEEVELAIVYELPPGRDGLTDSLTAQRVVTKALRAARGVAAEQVAVFVACERAGETLDDCASAWGATEVVR
jgi:hypothetical protein